MDFYIIGALKVFAYLGALIEEDEKNQVNFIDLPTYIIQNNILNHLKTDKTINRLFYDKDDYYLQIYYLENLKKWII